MTRDEMNTFLFLSICSQKDDKDAYQPEVCNEDENEGLPLLVIISLILMVLLSLLIITV